MSEEICICGHEKVHHHMNGHCTVSTKDESRAGGWVSLALKSCLCWQFVPSAKGPIVEPPPTGWSIYLSGPMSGKPLYNFPAFKEAAQFLTDHGHRVHSPVDVDNEVWQRHYGRDFDPAIDRCDYGHHLLPEMMRGNIRAILDCHAIAFLSGWEQSRGACFEKSIAEMLGLLLIDAATTLPLSEARGSEESVLQEAHRLVHGDRNADYGHPLDNFEHTAGLYSALLGTKLRDGERFTADDVWQLMVCAKLSRERHRPKRDNRVDIAGYAGTGEMVAQERERRKKAS